jgi:hypothetical protein
MWGGVTAVPLSYAQSSLKVRRLLRDFNSNAGPGNIIIQAWYTRPDKDKRPDTEMEVRPGSIRAVWGALVRVTLQKQDSPSLQWQPSFEFAAAGWRTNQCCRWAQSQS